MPEIQFPHGMFPVDAHFRELYTRDYSRAEEFPLPDELPLHHPLLRSLEGTYPLLDRLAPWWSACVAQVDPVLRGILATVSAREFRDGCIEQVRWKQFRQSLTDEARARVPNSPKLAPMVERTTWSPVFTQRGPINTPEHLDLIISTSPLYALYMANGCDWDSCQHFQSGSVNYRLVGNFYDTGVATALVLAPHSTVWEEQTVLARTTLRVFEDQEGPRITI